MGQGGDRVGWARTEKGVRDGRRARTAGKARGEGSKGLEENQKVEFDITESPKGSQASNVRSVA